MLIQAEDILERRHAERQMINLADFAVADDVLGPGRRAIIWVQGCPRCCSGCITPHMQRFDVDREWVTPEQLARRVLAQMPVEGITFVGGEPFSHAGQLATLVRRLRETADLSVVTYTGHTLARIRTIARPEWLALLQITDLLIDGEYIAAQHCDLVWRGSANQQLHFLTDRYRALAPLVVDAHGQRLEIRVTSLGHLRVIGIPEQGFFDRLAGQLRQRDMELVLDEPGALYSAS